MCVNIFKQFRVWEIFKLLNLERKRNKARSKSRLGGHARGNFLVSNGAMTLIP